LQPDSQGRMLKEEIDLLGPRAPSRRFPPDIQQRVVSWAKAKQDAGISPREISDYLGIPWGTITKWIRRAAVESVPSSAPAQPNRTPPMSGTPAMRPVKLVAARQRRTAGYVLRTPRGFTAEGLDLAALLHLLSRLG
jgi:transposase